MFTKGGTLFKEWQRDGSKLGLVTKTGLQAARQWGGWGTLADARKRVEVWVVKKEENILPMEGILSGRTRI